MFKNIVSFTLNHRTWNVAPLAFMLSAMMAANARADEGNADERFSPRGIKAAITLGGLTPSSTQDLKDGGGGGLRFGYGFNEHVTLWANMTGSEHEREKDALGNGIKSDVGGLELCVQYAIRTDSRVQPYGRFGFGGYSIEDRKSHDAWVGGGVTFGVGADYLFSKHWAVGAEMTYRGVDYTQGRVGKKGDFRDLAKTIDGDASGFALSLTVL